MSELLGPYTSIVMTWPPNYTNPDYLPGLPPRTTSNERNHADTESNINLDSAETAVLACLVHDGHTF